MRCASPQQPRQAGLFMLQHTHEYPALSSRPPSAGGHARMLRQYDLGADTLLAARLRPCGGTLPVWRTHFGEATR